MYEGANLIYVWCLLLNCTKTCFLQTVEFALGLHPDWEERLHGHCYFAPNLHTHASKTFPKRANLAKPYKLLIYLQFDINFQN